MENQLTSGRALLRFTWLIRLCADHSSQLEDVLFEIRGAFLELGHDGFDLVGFAGDGGLLA